MVQNSTPVSAYGTNQNRMSNSTTLIQDTKVLYATEEQTQMAPLTQLLQNLKDVLQT